MKPTLVRWDEIEWRQIPKHPLIEEAYSDPSGLIRHEAAFGLAEMGGPSHYDILIYSKEEWAARSLRVWKMLVDKIEPGGAVLPQGW